MNYITTSRKPSLRVRALTKQLAFLFGATYITRGKGSISDLISNARYAGVPFVFVVTEQNGNPHQLLMMQVTEKNWEIKETFFLTIILTRGELKLGKSFNNMQSNFVYVGKNKTLQWIFKTAGVEQDEDSELVLKDAVKRGFSIFFKEKEIGPAFNLANRENTEEIKSELDVKS